MTIASEKLETSIARRDLLTLVGTTAAAGFAAASPVFAQSQTPMSGPGSAEVQSRSTVTLDRLPMGVLRIGIDRVEAQNRIDIPTFNALGQAYYEFEHDNDLRVAVLCGKGPDFSRGLDLPSWGAGLRAGPFQAPPKFIDPLGTTGPERSKPLVVAVQGHATRIAHELFLAADLRVAAQDAVFNQGEVAAASFPGGGATVCFVREAGWGNTMRYMLTGDDWRADDAYRMGLVQALTPPGQQLGRAIEFAKRVAAAAPLAVRATLASAHRALSKGAPSAGLRRTIAMFALLIARLMLSGFIAPIVLMMAAVIGSASAQEPQRAQQPAPFPIADDVSVRNATIWSEGTRMAANVYSPKGVVGKLPTIVMAYGWSGTMERFRAEGAAFAHAGYLVVMFDYRGWGESDSRVILAAPEPAERPGNRFTAEVIELREILDPLAEVADLSNVIHWVQAEPQSDTGRIGLWGTSFGGGIAAFVAGYDHRVKALHVQVAPLELRALDPLGYQDGTKRARGGIGYPKPGLVVISGLRGAPITERFLRYSPAHALSLASDCAIQIVLAGKEELFDIRPVIAAYEDFKGSNKNLVIIPEVGHYDIYGKARDQARQLALAWFDKYLRQ